MNLHQFSDANRKLNFLGMDGYNLFGKSKYFAPRVRWSILEKRVDKVKEAAKEYEDAFNNVMAIENVDTNFNKVSVAVITSVLQTLLPPQ